VNCRPPDPEPGESGASGHTNDAPLKLIVGSLKRTAARCRVLDGGETITLRATGFTMIADNLAVPFDTMVLRVPVTVERIELNRSEQIVAVCRRGRERQSLPILDLPLPAPPPDGAEWIEAYRQWCGEG